MAMALATPAPCEHRLIKGWYDDSPRESFETRQPKIQVDYDSLLHIRRTRELFLAFARAFCESGRTAVIDDDLAIIEERFQKEAEIWERETGFLSATPMRVLHPSYQTIMAMGPEIVPLLLRDLQKTRRHWFWALRHLTGADPVSEKDRGNLDKMIAAWIEWGRKEHKI